MQKLCFKQSHMFTCNQRQSYFETGRAGLKHCMQQGFLGGMAFKFYKYVLPFMDFQKLNLCEVLTSEPKIICSIIIPIESEHSYNTGRASQFFSPCYYPKQKQNKSWTSHNVETTQARNNYSLPVYWCKSWHIKLLCANWYFSEE